MLTAPRTLPLISTLALWGVLASVPQPALGIGAQPVIRGAASLDAAIANGNSQVEQRCLNNGSGGFTACASFNTADNSLGVALGDVDGDGDLDAVIATNSGTVEQRCLNDGSGGFTACASFNTTDTSRSIALGDVDGDGDLDVIIANNGAEQRCLNDGSGGFAACASFNATDNSRSIALGDVDGDGDLDAVVANFSGFERRCLNDGSGGFTNCANFNATDNSYGIALGDLDGDGDLDVVVANSGVEQRCLNDGSGGFTQCASFNTTDDSTGLALGDVDGDGDLDAVIANSSAVEQRCLNDGSGGFTACTSFNTADQSFGIALGDVDGDGDLDAVVANFGAVERRCLNDGSGNFLSCASFNTTDNSFGIALGRLDSDGLTDVTTRFVNGVTTSNFGLQTVGLPSKPAGLTALYQFDAKYCNQSATETLSNLRTRTVRITQNNSLRFEDFALPADKDKFLSAPEWREGGIGAELVIPTAGQTFGYADGVLAQNTGTPECAVIQYKFNLFSLSKYKFAVRLYGVATAADALPDSLVVGGNVNDLSAVAATEIELDLGALQATTTETLPTSVPPAGSPGGSAPVPITPTTLSFPAGTSNLPSRR